jgi:predicted RNA-binding Zn-ribbon protein involved in translation (DUF1610 family)
MRDIDLFQLALGLVPPWMVVAADFDAEKKRLDIEIDFKTGGRFPCPECGKAGCPVHDTVKKTWRHLDFFQHQAFLHARVARIDCPNCGVRLVDVPWARPGSGFALVRGLCHDACHGHARRRRSPPRGRARYASVASGPAPRREARNTHGPCGLAARCHRRDRGYARPQLHYALCRYRHQKGGLRRRFAIRTLVGWYREGMDVEKQLPALSTYLGHTCVRDTYWYLSAVQNCCKRRRGASIGGGRPNYEVELQCRHAH